MLLTGFSLSYVSIDNIFNGPFRGFLKNYITLGEFGSNIREEVLYYLILIIGGFQFFTAVQSIFQPVLEFSESKIAMRTSEKLLTVVKDIQDNSIVMGYPAVPLKDFIKKNKYKK